jgi:hypothetical protein
MYIIIIIIQRCQNITIVLERKFTFVIEVIFQNSPDNIESDVSPEIMLDGS